MRMDGVREEKEGGLRGSKRVIKMVQVYGRFLRA
jgi:hypothetical protein